MSKKQSEQYSPTKEETDAMRLCWKNDLAYVVQPVKGSVKFNIVKFQLSNHLEVHTLKENNIDVEFTDYDAGKKVMELYSLHAKRFK